MVQLSIISGRMAGDNIVVRHFPFNIGRSPGNHFCFDDEGVWSQHLILDFKKSEGFTLQTLSGAFASINEQPQTSVRLRNGDIISFGSAKMQFWLAPVRQKSLSFRELSVWLLLAAITAAQIFLILRLVK